ncbi:MAG: outer membrane protein TolC [Arenicella sp.]|jgi:outer membrane protein TolC
MKKLVFYILFFGLSNVALTQENIMSFDDFIGIVLEHHPMSRQADIKSDYGITNLAKSRGNFDPKLEGNINQKYFKSDQYYNVSNIGLKVPTWYGISFKGGYDLNSGVQLNPERLTPDDGLWYAGVEVSLGKGLIIDKRRAEFKKAKIFAKSAEQDRRLMLNKLVLQAGSAYWEWFKAYNKMMVYQKAVSNSQEIMDNVRKGAMIGDRPFMDTLEANVQLQTQRFNYMQTELDYLNAMAYLEIYLWKDGYLPLELDSNTFPPSHLVVNSSIIEPELLLKVDSLKTNHPALLNANYKIETEKIELKLAWENVKPKIDLKYNALNSAEFGNPVENYSIENYVWGASFKMPLFLRKERNQIRLSKLKVEHQELDFEIKSQEIGFKIESAINSWQTSKNQIDLWQSTVLGFEKLLQNENTLYAIGESSLFKVNSRQKSYINSELMLIETVKKNQKAALKARYILGILN